MLECYMCMAYANCILQLVCKEFNNETIVISNQLFHFNLTMCTNEVCWYRLHFNIS